MTIQFPRNYKEILREGLPSLEFLFLSSESIKALEKLYNLPRTGNVYALFRNYAQQYYTLKCEAYHDRYKCLKLASEAGEKDFIEDLIQKGAGDWNLVMIYVARGGHLDLIQYCEYKIDSACDGNKLHLFPMKLKGSNLWNYPMINASYGGHLDIVQYCESKGANWWHETMTNAALGGHLDIIQYCELKGPIDWNNAMLAGAQGGHLNIVQYCESKGATNWKLVMIYATEYKYEDIIQYCESKHYPRSIIGRQLYNHR